MTKPFVTVLNLSDAEFAARMGEPKMSGSEAAARRYLGKKQAEKMARIERGFLIAWAGLAIGALGFVFYLTWGAM